MCDILRDIAYLLIEKKFNTSDVEDLFMNYCIEYENYDLEFLKLLIKAGLETKKKRDFDPVEKIIEVSKKKDIDNDLLIYFIKNF